MNLPDPRLAFEFKGEKYLVWPYDLAKDIKLPDGTLVRVTADGDTSFANVTSVDQLETPSGAGVVEVDVFRDGPGAPPGALH